MKQHKRLLPWPYYALVTGAGIGYLPFPGTLATLVAAWAAWVFYPTVQVYWMGSMIAVLLVTLVSLYSINEVLEEVGEHDPSFIVIDEIIATLLLVWALPYDTHVVLSAILLFRLFDGTKIGGIHWIEHLDRGWGVLGDDLFAALYTLAVLGILQYLHVLPFTI